MAIDQIKDDGLGRTCSTYGDLLTQLWSGHIKGNIYVEDQVEDGGVIIMKLGAVDWVRRAQFV